MSDAEKAAQIGEWMLLLEMQKTDLAHMRSKLEDVRKAYSEFASNRSRWSVDSSNSKRALLRGAEPDEQSLPSLLLNQAELAELLHHHDEAEAAVRRTLGRLQSVGIQI